MIFPTFNKYKIQSGLKIWAIIWGIIISANMAYGQQSDVAQVDSSRKNPILDTIQGQTVLRVCEKVPQFVGGNVALRNYLIKNISYPQLSDDEIVQSTIHVSFIIDTSGKIRSAYILNPLNGGTYTEIEKKCIKTVENMPDWIPAENKGKKVPVRFIIPFHIDPNH